MSFSGQIIMYAYGYKMFWRCETLTEGAQLNRESLYHATALWILVANQFYEIGFVFGGLASNLVYKQSLIETAG